LTLAIELAAVCAVFDAAMVALGQFVIRRYSR
jgi:hypothetical protein